MARYVIGDIQGCFDELTLLLDKIGYVPGVDRLYLVGDLVNRGPDSLKVLRWAFQERAHVQTVLGNHDLHLLACAVGVGKLKQGDTLAEILTADDRVALLDWLRFQPLLITLDDVMIVHAGIMPAWDEDLARALADEVSSVLAGHDHRTFLLNMYGNHPGTWSENLCSLDRMRLAVNAFTRMRMVAASGTLDFKFKGELERAPKQLLPWFDFPLRVPKQHRIVCGHWSALGLFLREDVWSLDTGCVWGGCLTAIRLEDGEVFQVQALRRYQDSVD